MKRQWYRIENAADGEAADVYVYDYIGRSFWDDDTVTAKRFLNDLKALPDSVKTIRVHVNSPGGDVFEALAIANSLRAQRTEKGRTVEMVIEGLAASAATIITSAGSPIRIADNALMMVHDPSGLAIGNAPTMRKMADALDRARDAIVATYQWASELSAEDLSALMAETTWMNASEAVEKGFATDITEAFDVAASFCPQAVEGLEVPEPYRARVEALVARPEPAPEAPPTAVPAPAPSAASATEVLRLCREGEVLDMAEGLIEQQAGIETVRAAVAAERGQRQAEAARQAEIRSLCETSELAELAPSFIEGGMPAAAVRAQLTIMTARLDKVEIDAGLDPDHKARGGKKPLSAKEIYAELNRQNLKE